MLDLTLWGEFQGGSLQAFTCVELFAGDGNVGKSTRYGLVATAQLDIKYGTGHVSQHNAFDLGSPAGLPFLGLNFGHSRDICSISFTGPH